MSVNIIQPKVDLRIYNQYLKALTSRATLVLMNFTSDHLNNLKGDGDNENRFKNDFFQQTMDSMNSDKNQNAPNSIQREVILLETRLSYNVPNFNYALMKNDPKIQAFEKKIFCRICKT